MAQLFRLVKYYNLPRWFYREDHQTKCGNESSKTCTLSCGVSSLRVTHQIPHSAASAGAEPTYGPESDWSDLTAAVGKIHLSLVKPGFSHKSLEPVGDSGQKSLSLGANLSSFNLSYLSWLNMPFNKQRYGNPMSFLGK